MSDDDELIKRLNAGGTINPNDIGGSNNDLDLVLELGSMMRQEYFSADKKKKENKSNKDD